MRSFVRNSTLYILISFSVLSVFSQTRTDLEKKRKELLKDIELTNQLLSETKENKAASLIELETLAKQIYNREALIINISYYIEVLEENIDETAKIINALEKDLKALKTEYAKMIYYTYRNHKSYNKLFFIFSSDSFNEAYRRLNYLKRYTSYRKKQVLLIQKTAKTLNAKLADLSEKKEKKEDLLASQLKQKNKLDREKINKDELIGKLRKQEKQLLTKLYKKRQAAKNLNKAIAEIIKKELESARKKASKSKTGAYPMSPEAAILSKEFTSNKGKLPWPVDRGIIAHNFGERPHPVLKGVKIQNNGIDIRTTANATVRAVFDGKVAEVFFNPTFHEAVMVRHGDFYTVYTNLKEVFVKKGDQVQIKQTLGIVYTDSENSKTEVHFEIWKGFDKLNPAFWIFRK